VARWLILSGSPELAKFYNLSKYEVKDKTWLIIWQYEQKLYSQQHIKLAQRFKTYDSQLTMQLIMFNKILVVALKFTGEACDF